MIVQVKLKNWQWGRLRERSAREGNRSRGGNANFCRILSFPLLKRCLSRIKPTPPTSTKNKKRKQCNHHRFRLVQNMNYSLIPALISASSSDVIPVYLITVSSERLSASILRTVFRFSSASFSSNFSC